MAMQSEENNELVERSRELAQQFMKNYEGNLPPLIFHLAMELEYARNLKTQINNQLITERDKLKIDSLEFLLERIYCKSKMLKMIEEIVKKSV